MTTTTTTAAVTATATSAAPRATGDDDSYAAAAANSAPRSRRRGGGWAGRRRRRRRGEGALLRVRIPASIRTPTRSVALVPPPLPSELARRHHDGLRHFQFEPAVGGAESYSRAPHAGSEELAHRTGHGRPHDDGAGRGRWPGAGRGRDAAGARRGTTTRKGSTRSDGACWFARDTQPRPTRG
jgi:hypothetical protein